MLLKALLPLKVMPPSGSAPLFNGDEHVDAFADGGVEGEGVEAEGVADLGLGLAGERLEVASVAVGQADALGVFIQLGGVEGAGEDVLKDDGVRDADGLQVLHGRAQGAVGEVLIAVEDDLAHLDGGAFLDLEGDGDAGGRDGLDLGLDGGELVAVLAEQVAQDDLSALDAGGVVLAFTVTPALAFLKRSCTSESETALRPV